MESEDPLSQLADIQLPEPVSFWPLAPGWWVLIALFVLFVGWMVVLAFRKLIWKKRLEAAQKELDKAILAYRKKNTQENADENQAGLDYLYDVNKVLNRVALDTDPSQKRHIASLSGPAWLSYLDQSYGGKDFSEGSGKVLAEGQYRPVFAGEIEALYNLSKQWILSRYKIDNVSRKMAKRHKQPKSDSNRVST
jgi:hypothetical protein